MEVILIACPELGTLERKTIASLSSLAPNEPRDKLVAQYSIR